MKEFCISKNDEGRRLDRYITNILKNAPSSFAYKMLRKKNIVLNGKKASGAEILVEGDIVRFYLSDETFDKFSPKSGKTVEHIQVKPDIIYEDDDILIVNKPSGMLTQRAKSDDISLNEICLSYVKEKASLTDTDGSSFIPSVCNRLDRNTSGLVTFAKTYRAAKCLASAFRDRTIHKYYRCVVKGKITGDLELKGSLVKDKESNTVKVYDDDEKGAFIDTKVHPVVSNDELTMAEVLLITGKTHQIRAHLAHCGHPILGDPKYGDRRINEKYKRSHGIDSQMLECFKLVFPDDLEIDTVAGRTFMLGPHDDLSKVM